MGRVPPAVAEIVESEAVQFVNHNIWKLSLPANKKERTPVWNLREVKFVTSFTKWGSLNSLLLNLVVIVANGKLWGKKMKFTLYFITNVRTCYLLLSLNMDLPYT
jgi:hypothetical protein